MAFEATAELYKRQYDLAKRRSESEYQSRIGELATQYRQANRDLEGNLEARGVLRSGEAMRGRVRLGAAEKAAQLAALSAQQGALDEAGLSYLQQLAELQAKGFGEKVAPLPEAPPATGGGGRGGGGGADAELILGHPKSEWDKVDWAGLGEIIKKSRTVGGTPIAPGDTPTETRPPAPNTVGGGASGLPAPGGQMSGPDRRLPNGGAVVDGIYIPPGTFASQPAPSTTTSSSKPAVSASPPGPAPDGYSWKKINNNWVLQKNTSSSGGGLVTKR